MSETLLRLSRGQASGQVGLGLEERWGVDMKELEDGRTRMTGGTVAGHARLRESRAAEEGMSAGI